MTFWLLEWRKYNLLNLLHRVRPNLCCRWKVGSSEAMRRQRGKCPCLVWPNQPHRPHPSLPYICWKSSMPRSSLFRLCALRMLWLESSPLRRLRLRDRTKINYTSPSPALFRRPVKPAKLQHPNQKRQKVQLLNQSQLFIGYEKTKLALLMKPLLNEETMPRTKPCFKYSRATNEKK